MGFFLKEVVKYLCRCDYCGKVADEYSYSTTGDRWNARKWAKLRRRLLKIGWRSKKTGTLGHAHDPDYRWACPACADKISTDPPKVIEEKTA